MRHFPADLLALVLLLASWSPLVVAQGTEPGVQTPAPSIEQRQRDVRQALEEIGALESAADPQTAAGLQAQADMLRAIEVLLELQVSAVADREELSRQLQTVTDDVERQRAAGLAQAPPYTLADLDAALDLRDQIRARLEANEVDIKESEADSERAVEALDAAQRARRRAREALDASSDPAAAGALSRDLRTLQIEQQMAAEQVELRGLERAMAGLTAAIAEQQLVLVEERIALIEPGVVFSQDELAAVLQNVDARRQSIETELQKIDQLRAEVERNSRIGAVETADALTRLRQARGVLGKQLERNAVFAQIWSRRYAVRAGTAERTDLRGWLNEATQASAALSRERTRSATRLAELQSIAAPETAMAKRITDALQQALQAEIAANDALRRHNDRLAGELTAHIDGVDWGGRLDDLGAAASNVWRYELAVVEDQPITVATAVSALAVLVIGVMLSRRLSRLFGLRLLKRLGLEEGTAAAYQMLLFYFLVSLFLLFALRALNMPLTIFTVAGGALAIGVGFGSQNILNNFISGLILLAERPIRLGDMVDVEGTYGAVKHIGLRSTRVRSFNNVDIIVPNSTFLEKNVVNWTLSDDRIRVNVNVGVMYGSDTAQVDELIRQAVNAHTKVLTDPPPIVLFADFGDDALMFEVHFWIRMRKLMDRRIVESDIRYEIDKLFRAAAIVIAYPQRDVHLDTLKPLDVRLVVADGERSGSATDPQ